MRRIIYNTVTGEIKSNRNIPDYMLAKNLAKEPNLASIDGSVADISVKKVDLDTLTVVDNIGSTDWNKYLRLYRNGKLAFCDWTVVPDSPLSDSKKAEWQAYRTALRDLPTTLGNVTSESDIIWPTPPE